jgi:hypothetical protein
MIVQAKGQPAMIVPTTTQTPKAIIPAETTISMIGRALFMHQRENSTQITAPHSATNQAIEIQKSASCRVIRALQRQT